MKAESCSRQIIVETLWGETVQQNEELIKSENPHYIHVNAQYVHNIIVVTS